MTFNLRDLTDRLFDVLIRADDRLLEGLSEMPDTDPRTASFAGAHWELQRALRMVDPERLGDRIIRECEASVRQLRLVPDDGPDVA